MTNSRRQLILWVVVGVVFILSLYVSDFWVSFIFAVIIALFRDETYEKECFKSILLKIESLS